MITAVISSKHTNSERRIDPNSTIESLRDKLEKTTGIPPGAQQWLVSLPTGHALNVEFLPQQTLSFYIPADVSSIHIDIRDTRPEEDQLNLDDSVEKYEMSDSKYEARQDSVLNWKKSNHLGRFSHSSLLEREDGPHNDFPSLGSRVSVTLKSGNCPNGTVGYVGLIPELPGKCLWVGVVLDCPEGKNNGIVKGQRYLECQDLHGVFVKPSALRPENETIEKFSDDEV